MDWLFSQEGNSIIRSIIDPQTYERKTFGFLQKPLINTEMEEVTFKIYICGKAGVGKADAISLLTGQETFSYNDVEGISVVVTYWPVKILNSQVVLFRLEFWDAEEPSLKKFPYILPSCKEEVDAVLHTFSFTDRRSFEEIVSLVSDRSSVSTQTIVLGTRFDNSLATDITLKDVTDFEEKYAIPVIKIRKYFNLSYSTKQIQKFKFGEAAYVLNNLCNHLWKYRLDPQGK